MKNKYLSVVIAILAWFALSGWGYTGHRAITLGASKSFLPEMKSFQPWVEVMANHSSDADSRKGWDKAEGKKHYIDVDNYDTFLTDGHISTSYEMLVERYGADFVHKQGTLPWATLASFDSLVACFEQHNFDKAVLTAADLSHYVADGHIPLHITKNYNGQLTGNDGIHSRYESEMISMFVDEINFEKQKIQVVKNPADFIFQYLYDNYIYVDSIIMADDYAVSVAGNNTSVEYQTALWNRTSGFTNKLYKDAALTIARLFYTAWVQAGAPDVSDHTFSESVVSTSFGLKNISIDYDNYALKVMWQCENAMQAVFSVYDISNHILLEKDLNIENGGVHETILTFDNLTPGKYKMVFSGEGMSDDRSFVIRK